MTEPTAADKQRFSDEALDAIREGDRPKAIRIEVERCIEHYEDHYGKDAGYNLYSSSLRAEGEEEIRKLSWPCIIF